MFCPWCGQNNTVQAKFCNICGKQLPQGNTSGGAQSAQQPSPLSLHQQSGINNPGLQSVNLQSGPTNQQHISSHQKPIASPRASVRSISQLPQPIKGIVQNYKERNEQYGIGQNQRSIQIKEFIVDFRDGSGNVEPIQVEMRGRSFEGTVNNGDEVNVWGSWKNGLLRADRIENLKTHVTVTAQGLHTSPFWMVFYIIVTIFVLIWIGYIFLMVITHMHM